MRLYDFILTQMEAILVEWENFARSIQPSDGNMEVAELRDHAEKMLRFIAADMQSPQTERESIIKSKGGKSQPAGATGAEDHALGRLEYGFSISLMVSEYRALRASVLRLWSREEHCQRSEAIADIIRFNEAIDQLLAESAEEYSDALRLQQDIFVGILGHDLRTPLQSISYSAQFLMQSEGTDSNVIRIGARMYNSVRRMAEMIDNLLDFTKSRVGGGIEISPEEIELATVAEQIVEEFRSYNPGREIRYRTKRDCKGEWDAGRVARVYQNLLANAIQYGSADKPITVRTEGTADEVVIQVHNEGAPIPAPEQQLMFGLFHHSSEATNERDRSKNLGLGLYIVREIVAAHRGSISVTSSEEDGTQFTVRLPKHQRNAPFNN